ncbi:hypothetical protein OSTOST_14356, partial [Ostertagia ostertagi]
LLGGEGLLQQEVGAVRLGLQLVLGRDVEAQQRQVQARLRLLQALEQLDAGQRGLGEPVGDEEIGLEQQALSEAAVGVGAAQDAVGGEALALQQLAGEGLDAGKRVDNEKFQGSSHGYSESPAVRDPAPHSAGCPATARTRRPGTRRALPTRGRPARGRLGRRPAQPLRPVADRAWSEQPRARPGRPADADRPGRARAPPRAGADRAARLRFRDQRAARAAAATGSCCEGRARAGRPGRPRRRAVVRRRRGRAGRARDPHHRRGLPHRHRRADAAGLPLAAAAPAGGVVDGRRPARRHVREPARVRRPAPRDARVRRQHARRGRELRQQLLQRAPGPASQRALGHAEPPDPHRQPRDGDDGHRLRAAGAAAVPRLAPDRGVLGGRARRGLRHRAV